jgi:hypothetical protein
MAEKQTHLPLRQKRNAPGGLQRTLCGRAVDYERTPYLPRGMVSVTCKQCRLHADSVSLSEWLFTPEKACIP